MGYFEDWFFVSKKEHKRRLDELSVKIFQFGDEAQRPLVIKVLRDLYGDMKRMSDEDRIFAFVSSKNQYIIDKDSGTKASEAGVRAQLKKLGWKDEARVRLMIAFLQLDEAAGSLEAYPTAADVRSRAGQG